MIGTGNYAKVKIGFSEEYGKRVAVKIISKVKAPSEYTQKFLPREIEAVKGLHHENLITFYQSIETSHRLVSPPYYKAITVLIYTYLYHVKGVSDYAVGGKWNALRLRAGTKVPG